MNILLCERLSETNQYVEQLTEAYQKAGHSVILDVQNFLFSDFTPDFVHLQWPEAIYRWRYSLPTNRNTIKFFTDRLAYYSFNKVPIVYTVHNLAPHENATKFDNEIFREVSRFSDILVHHGNSSIPLMKKKYPECINARHIVCPHGSYPFIKKDGKEARKIYGLPDSKYIFLNFGLQREYKGFKFIKEVFRRWSDNTAYLFTIGPRHNINSNKLKILAHLLKTEATPYLNKIMSPFSKNKKTILRPVSNNETPYVLAAADALFLGHQNGLNSGLLAMAASYGKPVIFPDIGNFKEQLIGWPWQESYEVGNIDSAIEALCRIKERMNQYSPGSLLFDNTNWVSLNSWDKHVQIIIETVDQISG